MKEESLLLLSDLQKLINQVVLIDYTIVILGGIIMRVVNPLNKTPMSSEIMVNGGCHCVCTSGRNVSYAAAWLPVVPNCQCSCGGGTTNENDNYQLAYNAAH